jgi:hypothetical protein
MKIKSGIFLLSIGLCITVGNIAQATGRTAPTVGGMASDFSGGNSFEPIPGSILGPEGRDRPKLRSLKVQCPKNGFLMARADALFRFVDIPAKLPGATSVRFGVTRGDEELAAFFTEPPRSIEVVPLRRIVVLFSNGSEENGQGPSQPGSIQRVDSCREGDEFSYAFNVRNESTTDEDKHNIEVVAPILVIEFFEKSIQIQ